MQSNYHLRSKFYIVGVLASAFLLASCGSYQYAGYEEDAIYGTSNDNSEYVENSNRTNTESQNTQQNNNGYYSNYFKDKSEQYGSVTDDDVIFTDIDSYEGSYSDDEYSEGYAGWGEDHNEDVVINIYGGHLYNSIWWNRTWGWNAGIGWNRPWGWNYGWNLGLNWWNNPWGWNAGWGWGWNDPWFWNGGWYNPWGWNTAFWCPPYYGGGFYNGYGYYGRRAVAFNASRRNSNATGLASLGRRSTVNSNANVARRGSTDARISRRSRADVSRPNTTARPGNTRPYSTRPSSTRPSNTRPMSTRPSSKIDKKRTRPHINNSSRGNPRINNSSRSRSGSQTRATTRRNNSNYGNRSSSRSRSSGVSRSSSPSRSSGVSRSSSPSRSSGRSGGSRRNN